MSGLRTRAGGLLAAGVVAGCGLLGGGIVGAEPVAAAPTLPTDPSADGTIGLCSRDGAPVTSGRTTDKPFVWRAVGSKRAPSPFDGDGATATLYGYQPRSGVSPDQWSGDTLTASSGYTNAAHPMAQATQLDFTLQDLLAEYPPKLDGLVQLRLVVGAGGVGAAPTYATAVVQVQGTTWKLLAGSSTFSCTDGTATSSEVDAGIVDAAGNAVGTAAASLSASASAEASSAAAAPGATVPGAAPGVTATPTSSSAATRTTHAAAADPSGGGSTSWVLAGVGGVVVLAAGTGWWWRRRSSAGRTSD